MYFIYEGQVTNDTGGMTDITKRFIIPNDKYPEYPFPTCWGFSYCTHNKAYEFNRVTRNTYELVLRSVNDGDTVYFKVFVYFAHSITRGVENRHKFSGYINTGETLEFGVDIDRDVLSVIRLRAIDKDATTPKEKMYIDNYINGVRITPDSGINFVVYMNDVHSIQYKMKTMITNSDGEIHGVHLPEWIRYGDINDPSNPLEIEPVRFLYDEENLIVSGLEPNKVVTLFEIHSICRKIENLIEAS